GEKEMMAKLVNQLYELECDLYFKINNRFDRQVLNVFFRRITHFGGAWITISFTLLFLLFVDFPTKWLGFEIALSLLTSHLFVVFMKKVYPRARPYISLTNARVVENPLTDHSFPSGHTTAIFSIITPLVIHLPILGILLYPLAVCVGLS